MDQITQILPSFSQLGPMVKIVGCVVIGLILYGLILTVGKMLSWVVKVVILLAIMLSIAAAAWYLLAHG